MLTYCGTMSVEKRGCGPVIAQGKGGGSSPFPADVASELRAEDEEEERTGDLELTRLTGQAAHVDLHS